MTTTRAILILGFTVFCIGPAALAQQVGQRVVINETVPNDLYIAGQDVEIRALVRGDAVVGGRSILIADAVSEDVLAAGRDITLEARIGDDARLAGRTIVISDIVKGHVVAAGAEIRLDSNSNIADWAWLAGAEVRVDGDVGDGVRIAARDIEISGRINGNAELAGDTVRIADGAIINGDLICHCERDPDIADGAVVAGNVVMKAPVEDDESGGWPQTVFILLAMIFAAGVLYSLFRRQCDACADLLIARPGASLVTGLVVFATTPVIAMLLFATGIGALLGGVVVLGYALLLLLGTLVGIILIARAGLARFGRGGDVNLWLAWSAIAIVTIAIRIFYIVPAVGTPIATAVMLLGIGALSLRAWGLLRSPAAA
ncbi:MAG: hypothetical protein ACR2QV_03015 [Gammaproteobacteria bacterium]